MVVDVRLRGVVTSSHPNLAQRSFRHIHTPLLLNPSIKPPACIPAQDPRPPITPRIFSPSCSRLVRNSPVSTKSFDVSVVINNSALAYIAARAARLVYQAEVTVVLPARNSISSERRASSLIEVGRWRGVERRARASCHRCIIGLLACNRRRARFLMLFDISFGEMLLGG